MKQYLIIIIALLLLPLVIASNPIISSNAVEGYQLMPSYFEATKAGVSRDVYIQVVNLSSGSVVRLTGISCYVHTYKEFREGDHMYINYTPVLETPYDYGFYMSASNFTEKGQYSIKYFCNDSDGRGGIFQMNYYVTGNGHPPASDITTAIIYLMFLLSVFLFLYFTIINVAKLAMTDTSLLDVVYSVCTLCLILLTGFLGTNLLLTTIVETLCNNMVLMGSVTLGIIPFFAFIITVIIKSMEKKEPLGIQELTGRRIFLG